MNAAARTLHEGNFFRGDLSVLSLGKKNFLVVMLFLLVLASSLSVVYLRNIERHYYSVNQTLVKQHNQIEIEKSQLLLEQGMWSAPRRVQKVANNRLGMVSSEPKAIIVIEGNVKN